MGTGEVESSFAGEDFLETLTRARSEKLNTDLFRETLEPVPEVLEDDNLTKKEIDKIVPVGGSTRSPKVQSHIGGYPRGKTQERKGEMGDNMRCLCTVVTMPRCIVDCLYNVVTCWTLLFQPK